MAKAPSKAAEAAAAGAPAAVPVPVTRIRALTPLDVDNVRIEEGEVAEIRTELVAELVARRACDEEPAEA